MMLAELLAVFHDETNPDWYRCPGEACLLAPNQSLQPRLLLYRL